MTLLGNFSTKGQQNQISKQTALKAHVLLPCQFALEQQVNTTPCVARTWPELCKVLNCCTKYVFKMLEAYIHTNFCWVKQLFCKQWKMISVPTIILRRAQWPCFQKEKLAMSVTFSTLLVTLKMDHSFWKQHEHVNLSDTDCEDVITSSFVYQCILQQSVRMPTIICKAVCQWQPFQKCHSLHGKEKERMTYLVYFDDL